jgi:hypothetical protein
VNGEITCRADSDCCTAVPARPPTCTHGVDSTGAPTQVSACRCPDQGSVCGTDGECCSGRCEFGSCQ